MDNRTCRNCDAPVTGSSVKVFCSKKCAGRWHKRKSYEESMAKGKKLAETFEPCPICGEMFALAVPRKCGGYAKRTLCGTECRAEAKRRKEREAQREFRKTDDYAELYARRLASGYFAERNKAMRDSIRKLTITECRYCGAGIEHTVGMKRVVCGGQSCQSAYDLDRCHMRNARLRAARTETFSRLDVFNRDGWICQLCGDPVDMDAPPRSPLSASLDHIIPLSRGGEHSIANTQCAHLVCNMKKSNNLHLPDGDRLEV